MPDRIAKNRKQAKLKLGGMNESQNQLQGRMSGPDNTDIDAVFRGIQQTRGMVRRDLSGNIANPNAPSGLDKLYADNPHLRGAADRQAQYDQQARAELQGRLQSAIAERKALQEMQQYNPNLITDANGYRTIFDSKGGVIGTTAPVKSGFSGYKGETAADAQNAFNRGEGTDAERGIFRRNLQQTGLDSAAGKIKKPTKSSGIDAIFGRAKQPSPSGGTAGDLVGSSGSQGAPGGELFGQMPEFKSSGMAMPQQKGPKYPPNAGPRYTPMMPNDGPQNPSDFGPQLPYSGGEQLMALKRLYGFGGNNNPTLTTLEGLWSDIFPNRPDEAYLRQLFPGLVHPQAGSGELMTQLAKMYQSPAYQSQFPYVNQSEFYK